MVGCQIAPCGQWLWHCQTLVQQCLALISCLLRRIWGYFEWGNIRLCSNLLFATVAFLCLVRSHTIFLHFLNRKVTVGVAGTFHSQLPDV